MQSQARKGQERPRRSFLLTTAVRTPVVKTSLIPDLELWGWGFLDFVCFSEEGLSWLWIEAGEIKKEKEKKASSVPETGTNVWHEFSPQVTGGDRKLGSYPLSAVALLSMCCSGKRSFAGYSFPGLAASWSHVSHIHSYTMRRKTWGSSLLFKDPYLKRLPGYGKCVFASKGISEASNALVHIRTQYPPL